MTVLVSAASKHGSTEEIARAISDALGERGIAVEVVAPDDVRSLEGFDAVVLGSAVYAGRWMKPALDLVERLEEGLAARPTWLFSSGPVGDPPKPEEDPVDVADVMERTGAREHRVFAGRIVRGSLSFPEKAIVMALRVPDGDFRDWEAVRSWAEGIAAGLTS